jgi:hypothetical protein
MNIFLWVVAAVLAALFLMAGLMKAVTPVERLRAQMGWVDDFPAGSPKVIGVLEVLGAIGLIVPGATDIAPVIVPIAAVGLGLTMLGAVILHAVRKEPQVGMTAVLLVLCAVVAWGRFGPYAF